MSAPAISTSSYFPPVAVREGYRNALAQWTISEIFANRAALSDSVKFHIQRKIGLAPDEHAKYILGSNFVLRDCFSLVGRLRQLAGMFPHVIEWGGFRDLVQSNAGTKRRHGTTRDAIPGRCGDRHD